MRRGRLLPLVLFFCVGVSPAGQWDPLSRDGLHDPANPGIADLQEPAEALSALPPSNAGNQVLWAEAVQMGIITPRTQIYPETRPLILDLDVLMNRTGGLPAVRFPHRNHTVWLDCSNCHNELFKPTRGANKLSMFKMLQGEQCGLCHGAVAFPLTECNRCHNEPRPRAGTKR